MAQDKRCASGVRRVLSSIFAIGRPCDESKEALRLEGFGIELIAHPRDVLGPLMRSVFVFERGADTTRAPLDDLILLHRLYRDASLGYVGLHPNAEVRRRALRVGARYVCHSDTSFIVDLRAMAVALCRPARRLEALITATTDHFGLEDLEPRLLRYYLRSTPVPHIAESLDVTIHDVKYHSRKLIRKVGARNVADLRDRLSALEDALVTRIPA